VHTDSIPLPAVKEVRRFTVQARLRMYGIALRAAPEVVQSTVQPVLESAVQPSARSAISCACSLAAVGLRP
jgi:hypothetical protein